MMERLHSLLKKGVTEGVFPGAALVVSIEGEEIFFSKAGFRALIPFPEPIQEDTIFDLASLTKPFATTVALMILKDRGLIGLDQRLAEILHQGLPTLKGSISLRQLLNHSSGMPSWHPFFERLKGFPLQERKGILRKMLCEIPLAAMPAEQSIYSDTGFMLLEWVVEEVSGKNLGTFLKDEFYMPLGLKRTFIGHSVAFPRDAFAATEDCPWRGRVLSGETHDENAWVLGGFSGHAGLFSTAREAAAIAAIILKHYLGERSDFFDPETVREFLTKQKAPPGSTWALGWDTPSADGSSSGRFFSEKSAGHLGFTGTSVWIDLEKRICVTLLTNRIHPTRENLKIKSFRPALHDAVMAIL